MYNEYLHSIKQMATVTIDNKEYNVDDLSEDAKQLLSSLQFAQSEIQKIQGTLALLQTAASAYSMQLKQKLPQ